MGKTGIFRRPCRLWDCRHSKRLLPPVRPQAGLHRRRWAHPSNAVRNRIRPYRPGPVSTVSSPDCFHQDGEPFTFAHLVQRNSNAGGGNNYIGKIKCRNKKLTEISKEDIIDSFVLKKFLESFSVYDNAVSHYVDHLIKIDPTGEPAQRTMILIDLSLTK